MEQDVRLYSLQTTDRWACSDQWRCPARRRKVWLLSWSTEVVIVLWWFVVYTILLCWPCCTTITQGLLWLVHRSDLWFVFYSGYWFVLVIIVLRSDCYALQWQLIVYGLPMLPSLPQNKLGDIGNSEFSGEVGTRTASQSRSSCVAGRRMKNPLLWGKPQNTRKNHLDPKEVYSIPFRGYILLFILL